jgi:hypothetical protein
VRHVSWISVASGNGSVVLFTAALLLLRIVSCNIATDKDEVGIAAFTLMKPSNNYKFTLRLTAFSVRPPAYIIHFIFSTATFIPKKKS